jgi:hypothetical protein
MVTTSVALAFLGPVARNEAVVFASFGWSLEERR